MSFISPLDGLSGLTGAWSFSRPLLSTWTGALYTLTSGTISSLHDQSGAGRNSGQPGASGLRPALTNAGVSNRACASFDGTNDYLVTTATMDDFIDAGAGYIISSAIIDTIGTNAANTWQNDAIWADSGSIVGVHLKSANTIHGYNFDGTDDKTTEAVSTGTAIVVEWWHSGGNVNCRVNGGTTQTVASGNSTSLTGTMYFGTAQGAGTLADMKLFEAAAFSTVPGSTDRDALTANFQQWLNGEYGTGAAAAAAAAVAATTAQRARHVRSGGVRTRLDRLRND